MVHGHSPSRRYSSAKAHPIDRNHSHRPGLPLRNESRHSAPPPLRVGSRPHRNQSQALHEDWADAIRIANAEFDQHEREVVAGLRRGGPSSTMNHCAMLVGVRYLLRGFYSDRNASSPFRWEERPSRPIQRFVYWFSRGSCGYNRVKQRTGWRSGFSI
jgi:hypothetical protein